MCKRNGELESQAEQIDNHGAKGMKEALKVAQ